VPQIESNWFFDDKIVKDIDGQLQDDQGPTSPVADAVTAVDEKAPFAQTDGDKTSPLFPKQDSIVIDIYNYAEPERKLSPVSSPFCRFDSSSDVEKGLGSYAPEEQEAIYRETAFEPSKQYGYNEAVTHQDYHSAEEDLQCAPDHHVQDYSTRGEARILDLRDEPLIDSNIVTEVSPFDEETAQLGNDSVVFAHDSIEGSAFVDELPAPTSTEKVRNVSIYIFL
jgi:hypothetical protein